MAFQRTLVAVILAVVGLALDVSCEVRCWECTSSVSWKDCTANATQKTCGTNINRCGKTKFEYGSQKLFVKGCQKADACDSTCAEAPGSKCSSECCQGDLCNGDDPQKQTDDLKCFECKSSISKEDCEMKAHVKTCTQGQDQCSESMAVSSSTKLYGKECATKEVCANGVKYCEQWKKQGKSAKCSHRCCSGKLCNSVEASALKLKCFNCESQKSWADCEKLKRIENCTYGKNRCITVSTLIDTDHMSAEYYKRACMPSANCENPEAICNVFKKNYGYDIKCKTDSKCCFEDFCNGYSSARFSVVSVFTLLSCAVISFLQTLL